MLEAEYRQLTSNGAFQVARLFHLRLADRARPAGAAQCDRQRGHPRLYRGRRPASSSTPNGRVTAFGRYATDRTFMRRYDISRDDRLRSFVNAERITDDSYISIAGWAFEGLRRDRRRRAAADRLAGDRRALADRRSDRWAARSSSRRTASPSCGPRARTASAPSPARAGTGAASPARPGAGADRLCARRRLPRQRHAADPDGHLSRRGGLERPLHRRASPPTCNWPLVGELLRRHPAVDAAPPVRRLAADRAIWTSRTRMRARSTSRIRTCSRSTASPATTAGRTASA